MATQKVQIPTSNFIRVYELGINDGLLNYVNQAYSSQSHNVRQNLYAIIANLVWTEQISVSRSRKTYNSRTWPSWYTFSDAVRAQDILIEEGLVEKYRGRQGLSTRLKRLDKLDDVYATCSFSTYKKNTDKLSSIALNGENLFEDEKIAMVEREITLDENEGFLLERRKLIDDFNSNSFLGNTVLGFESSKLTLSTVREYASDLSKPRPVGMAENTFLTSMFTSNGGGRLYTRYASYQNIPQNLRRLLTLNGNNSRELDYSGMHVNLLYYLNGKANEYEDPYFPVLYLLGFTSSDTNVRDALKKLIITTINCNFEFEKSRKAFYYHNNDLRKYLESEGISFKDAFSAVNEAYGEVTQKNVDIHKLMYMESKIMCEVLRKLRNEKIVALPLHDSTIFMENNYRDVKDIMQATYRDITSRDILVK